MVTVETKNPILIGDTSYSYIDDSAPTADIKDFQRYVNRIHDGANIYPFFCQSGKVIKKSKLREDGVRDSYTLCAIKDYGSQYELEKDNWRDKAARKETLQSGMRDKLSGLLASRVGATRGETKDAPAEAPIMTQRPAEAPSPEEMAAQTEKKGMSKGMKIGLIVGGVAVVGLAAYLMLRKKK